MDIIHSSWVWWQGISQESSRETWVQARNIQLRWEASRYTFTSPVQSSSIHSQFSIASPSTGYFLISGHCKLDQTYTDTGRSNAVNQVTVRKVQSSYMCGMFFSHFHLLLKEILTGPTHSYDSCSYPIYFLKYKQVSMLKKISCTGP